MIDAQCAANCLCKQYGIFKTFCIGMYISPPISETRQIPNLKLAGSGRKQLEHYSGIFVGRTLSSFLPGSSRSSTGYKLPKWPLSVTKTPPVYISTAKHGKN